MTTKKVNANNMFEHATRTKMRFPTIKGEIGLEALWDVPLLSNDNLNLNFIAKTVNKDLGAAKEENFVGRAKKLTKAEASAEAKLNVIKYVIEVKEEEEEKAKNRASRREREQVLLGALEKKQSAALEGKTEAQIKKELAALREEDDEE